MAKLKKGQKLACSPCGREVIIGFGGVSETTVWCCGKPMKSKSKKAARKVSKKKKKRSKR